MRISAVIPFHHGNATLPRTLDALTRVKQPPGSSFDIVISCDGHDTAPDIAAAQTLPVTVISDDPRGQSAATNRGVRYARGDPLWLLAQDMLPRPDSLLRLLDTFQRFNTPLVQGRIEQDPATLDDPFVRHVVESGLQFTFGNIGEPDNLDPGLHYAPHALVSRESFLVLGGYDEQLPYGMQDTDFGLRWKLNHGRIVFAPASLAIHNHHYRFSDYRTREESVGHALVDMFIKWKKEAFLNRYLMTRHTFQQQLGPDLSHAREVAERWENTGEIPSGHGGFRHPLPVPGDPLKSAFLVALSWARVEGVYTRLAELGLLNQLPSLPSGFDLKNGHPTQWIRETANRGQTPFN